MGEQDVEQLTTKLTGDATSLVRAFQRGEQAADKFGDKVEGVARRVTGALDGVGSGAGAGVTRLIGQLQGLVVVLTGVSVSLTDVERKGDGTGRGIDNSAAAVRRLDRELKAGKISQTEYAAGLKRIADTAKEGSEKQLAALSRIRDAEEKEAQIARRIADEKERDARRVAEAAEDSARREEAAAKRKAEAAQRSAQQARQQAPARIAQGMDTLGRGLTGAVTATSLGAGIFSIKEGLSFDDAYTEVRKFTQGTESELSDLQKRLRAMALDKVIDTDFEDLAHIAAFGSQLGVAREDLAAFVRDVVYLGKAGDISGEEGATGLAKIAAAMKLPSSEIGRLSSSLAKMGEMGSSTLGEMLEIAKRLAAEGRLTGMDPSQVFAYANAVASLGQNAEAGGTALTTTFSKIDKAVNQGGEALRIYAETAGMTAEQFAKAYREDAGKAVQQFFAGLDRAGQKAGEVDKILGALGIKDVRETQAVKNLAAGHELLAEALDASAQAYASGDVARQKAAIAATSASAQLRQSWREVKEEAAAIGQDLIPAFLDLIRAGKPLVQMLADFARWFHALSPTQRQIVLGFIAMAGSLGPLLIGLARAIEVFGVLKGAAVALRGSFLLTTLSAEGVTAAIQAMAARGVAAMAAGGPLALAIIGITALVVALADQWFRLKGEQDAALQSAADYAEMQQRIAAMGPRHAKQMRQQQVAQGLSEKRDELANINSQLRLEKTQRPMGFLDDDTARKARIKKLEEDKARVTREVTAKQWDYDRLDREIAALPKDPKPGGVKPPPKKDQPAPNVNTNTVKPGKGTRVPGSVFRPVRVQRPYPFLPSDIDRAPTDAYTYGPKVQATEERFADPLFAAQQSNDAATVYSLSLRRLQRLITLSDEAIKATSGKMTALEPQLRQEEKSYQTAAANLQAYQDALKKKGRVGQKMTEAEQRRLDELKGALAASDQNLQDTRSEFETQKRANEQARDASLRYRGEKARAEADRATKVRGELLDKLQQQLGAGDLSRDQYDTALKSALERIKAGNASSEDIKMFSDALAESEKARKAAIDATLDEIAKLSGKDGSFAEERKRIQDEAAKRRKGGVSEGDVSTYESLANADVNRREFESGFKKADDVFQASLAEGEKTLAQYRDFLEAQLSAAERKFGETSAEAAKLSQALKKVDWQIVEQGAQALREAMDEGKISLQQYTVGLQSLQATVPPTAAAYNKLEKEIGQAQRRMREDARRTADQIADRYTDAFMDVFTGAKSVGQAVSDLLKDSFLSAVRDAVKRQVSKQIFRVLVDQNEDKLLNIARQQQAAAETHRTAAQTYQGAVQEMGAYVQRFVSALQGWGGTVAAGGGDSFASVANAAAAVASASSNSGSSGDDDNAVHTSGSPDEDSRAQHSGPPALPSGGRSTKTTRNIGKVTSTLGLVDSIRRKDVVGAASSGLGLAATGVFGGSAAAAATAIAPWLAGGLAVASLLGGLFKRQAPDYVLKTGEGQYNQRLATGDHTGLIDSGYSGVESMRQMQQQWAARQQSNATQSGGTSRSVTLAPGAIAAGAIVIHPPAGSDPAAIAREVLKQLGEQSALMDALNGQS